MKNYSGRWIIISLAVVCLLVAVVLYKVFKSSGDYKGLVLAKMHKEFIEYNLQKEGRDQILVAQHNGTEFFVDLRKEWDFQLHQKVLMVKAPALEPTPPEAEKAEIEKLAKAKIGMILEAWILDKFHSLKDITYQISF